MLASLSARAPGRYEREVADPVDQTDFVDWVVNEVSQVNSVSVREKAVNEAETRAELIDPALKAAG